MGTVANLDVSRFLFGKTPVMLDLRNRIDRIATTDLPVLITGETGTGKETLALEIHGRSQRSHNQFVKVNCAALPSSLIESELFGFERGAFTGAFTRRKGKFELAEGGSIFLDEIADLDLAVQPKLLQVLQDGNVSMLGGGVAEVVTNTRVICATNHDLEAEVQKGLFRQDLFYRINVVHLKLPALRARIADLPMLAERFMEHYRAEFNAETPSPSPALMDLFMAYSWPGNIRELENVVKQLVVLANEEELRRRLESCLNQELESIKQPDGTISLKKHVRALVQKEEMELIAKVLRHNHWNRKKTARMLKISYRALLYKLKDQGMDQPLGLPLETESV